jgi:hypothetical protein
MADPNKYQEEIEAALANAKESLSSFKSGSLRTAERRGDASDWTDTTDREIEHRRGIVALYEKILGTLRGQ